jgi:hypothetical protein
LERKEEKEMKGMKILMAVIIVMAAGLVPLSAMAAKGFYISGGLGFSFPSMSGEFMDEYNPGAGNVMELLNLGYGFTDRFAVGIMYGAAAGLLDDDFDEEATWGQGYLGITSRYSFDKKQQFVPYIELGVGSYLFMAMGDEIEMETETMTTGLRASVGANYYIGDKQRFFIAPELSYHAVDYDCDADIENDVEYSVEFDENASMFTILFKVGYHWKKVEKKEEKEGSERDLTLDFLKMK